MVLDFAFNIRKLGPINDPVIPRKKGESKGEVPIKTCDGCGTYNHISARYCGGEPYPTNQGCGAEFQFKVQLQRAAATDALIKDDGNPVVESFAVERVTMKEHRKAGKPPSIMVTYYCGLQKFNDFIFPELPGWGRRKSEAWWAKRINAPMPATTVECLMMSDQLEVPTHIRVWVNKMPYPQIMAETFIGAWEQKTSGTEVPF
jgi:DNA repair protein RadD